MGGLPEITEFLRRHRGGRSDDALRRDLLNQGHKPADIEAAFALSEPTVRFETQHKTEELEQGRPFPWNKLFAAFFTVMVLGTVGGLYWYGRGQRMQADDVMTRELAAYRPKALARPEHLDLVLPAGLIDADAAPDYAKLLGPSGDWSAGGEAVLAAALTKRRCTAALNWYPASPTEQAQKAGLLNDGITAADAALAEKTAAAQGEAALEAAGRRVLFGWHMMQDYTVLAQMKGLTAAQAGLADYAKAARAAGAIPPEGPLAFGKLAVELTAYAPDPEQLRAIGGLGYQRSDFAALARFVAAPELRRPYMQAALLSAATNWSREEVEAAQLWPERLEVLSAAGELIDPRAARIGQGWAALAEGLRKSVEEAGPAERAAVLKRGRSALAPVASF